MTSALRSRGEITIEVTAVVDDAVGDALWGLYLAAFEGLREHAASRHMLTRAEFDLEALDPRVDKYIAWRDTSPVGLVTLTRDLTTVPWISPEFYAARYPAQAAQRTIFYTSLAVVHPTERLSDAFPRLVSLAAEHVKAVEGVFAADMCRLNTEVLRLDRAVTALLTRAWGGVQPVELDRQVFLAWEPAPRAGRRVVPGPREPRPRA